MDYLMADKNPDSSHSQSDQQAPDGGGPQSGQGPQPTQQAGGQAYQEQSRQGQPQASGESITNIVSRPDTKPLIVQTVGLFAVLGVGYGIFSYLAVSSLTGEGALGGFGGGIAAFVFIFVAALIGPVVGSSRGKEIAEHLSSVRDDMAYATGVVGCGLGQLSLMLLTTLAATQPLPDSLETGVGDFLSIIAFSAVITAVVAALTMYVVQTVSLSTTRS